MRLRRTIIVLLIIILCFLLQTTVFQVWAFANISPNLLIIVVSAFGFMRGSREGMIIGFICGLIVDLFFGFYVGIYALLYMYIGFINGLFQKYFYPDDIKLPVLLISLSDVVYNLFTYFFMFMLRGRFHFLYYLKSIILPELVYTMVVAIVLYFVLLKINQLLEEKEKRSAKKFDL
ncbi:MAG: rod shape-determining protein MreD [Lachnospiraceae bacterium]|nr:rod shape-determining protein MreD [Lachnospiraceae bacterium]